MDVRFTRRRNGTLARSIYQKPTHTNRYLHYKSHHPSSVKSGVVASLAQRAIQVSSDEVERNVEFNKITETLAANGYPRKLVNKEISRQLKRSETCAISDDERALVTVSIPFIDGAKRSGELLEQPELGAHLLPRTLSRYCMQ